MKKNALIPIILILVLAIAGGAVYYFILQDKDKEKPKETYSYSMEEPFVTNVKDSKKLFKTTVVLVLDKDKMDETLSAKEYIIRDKVLFLLRDLTEDDITNQSIQDTLRTKITDTLNEALDINDITTVYFGDFVMQ